ncbi:MAG: sensor hybrid histidine kinase [Candidatus Saccharibacteria bacterium]|nr:sensor hybrid histidine kinase [Candidatus Saccharibacteria bacterium]
MQPNSYHALLLQQMHQALGENVELPPELLPLLAQISSTYKMLEEGTKQAQATATLRTEQLIASTSRAYSFLDSLNKGFIMCDTSGEIVLTNDSVRRTLSAKAASVTTLENLKSTVESWTIEKVNDLFQPDVALYELVKQCLASAKPVEVEETNFGKQVLRLYLAPLLNEPGSADQQLLGVVILVEDITDEKSLERSKDEFLSIASHELRTPLTAIRGNASLIKKYYADSIKDDSMAEMIDDIHGSAVRLIGIVNDFLDAAAMEQRKMAMKPVQFALADIVTEVVRELEHLCADKGVTLVADASVAAAPAVLADKMRIKQVLINLVGNAAKFTNSGSITISTRADESMVYTSVVDTGSGMSQEAQQAIFSKFHQGSTSGSLTRDMTKGTGLGLYISKMIVELSGGSIALEHSVPGEGSTFVFSLKRG